MNDFDMSGVPTDELSMIPGEERLKNFMELIQAQKAEPWESRLNDILDAFEDFLTLRPEPPQSWLDNYAASGKKFDYHQVVLPQDFQDPYEDDLGNIRRLRNEFERVPSTMALEHELVSRNYFIFENGHAEAIPAPRPMLMLESQDRDDDQEVEEGDITWDCCISIFADGSYTSYNLEHDDEEVLGEDFKAVFEKNIKTLSKLQLVIPIEGRDYGILRSDA
ncbi:MAG: hypothetical protein MJY99_02320 [Fibrobacter sp.]|uniref:hypothetical protein n=1 Tax=Fibrobacter sp. TaxID=35828 RepID=UPI00388D6504|nr:hypothetical protein [Fibrobacter sp.]